MGKLQMSLSEEEPESEGDSDEVRRSNVDALTNIVEGKF